MMNIKDPKTANRIAVFEGTRAEAQSLDALGYGQVVKRDKFPE